MIAIYLNAILKLYSQICPFTLPTIYWFVSFLQVLT